jgi:hypothetical protein
MESGLNKKVRSMLISELCWGRIKTLAAIKNLTKDELMTEIINYYWDKNIELISSKFEITAKYVMTIPDPELDILIAKINSINPQTINSIEIWAKELNKYKDKNLPKEQRDRLIILCTNLTNLARKYYEDNKKQR